MQPAVAGFDPGSLRDALEQIAAHLSAPATLCLIGSAPGMLSGQDRLTTDVDVWWPLSKADPKAMGAACRAAGVPVVVREDDPAPGYLQVVTPGVVHTPRECQTVEVARIGQLTITMPEPAALIAMKLVRGDDQDIADCTFWIQHAAVDRADVVAQVRRLPFSASQFASENMVMLELAMRAEFQMVQTASMGMGMV